MANWDAFSMIASAYREGFGAQLQPSFAHYLQVGDDPRSGAALGYSKAGDGALFLERYLDRPIEQLAATVLARTVSRAQIVEIGNFAASDAAAVPKLWCKAAAILGPECEFAVATLTRPLRWKLSRAGVIFHVLAPANSACMGKQQPLWGSYYQHDPQVCIGEIAAGGHAISAGLMRRSASREAA